MMHSAIRLLRAGRLAGGIAAALLVQAAAVAKVNVKVVQPDNSGLAKLLCASPYGFNGTDQIVGAAILPDNTILLAGNRDVTDLKKGKGRGFLLRLTVAGQGVTAGKPVDIPGHISRMELSPGGSPCLLANNAGVYLMNAAGTKPVKNCQHADIQDFGVDSNGELVILHGPQMTRYDKTWRRPLWSVTWHASGGNRPGGMTVCPASGVAAVVGYGMTHTGREPWKDPFAYGFDRAGKQIWKLWDPAPGKQVASSHGGNGLMADTTGKIAKAGRNGEVYLGLYADGGNSVCTRDPADPDQKLDPGVHDGVFQRGPGHGFKGASCTSVAFQVDSATGRLTKGTWMCAWLNGARANGLGMDDITTDEEGRVYVAGESAWGCPTRTPWFYDETAYRGGGYLAVFDKDFKMLQCGFFQQTSVSCVAAANGYVVIGGLAKDNAKDPDHPLQVHNPIQKQIAGGESDGYFAIFETGPHGSVASQPAEQPKAAEAKPLPAKITPADPPAAPKPQPDSPERKAQVLLQKADNYLRNKMRKQAKATLEEIIRDHPRTPAAQDARRVLEEQFPEE